jgi:hypothetical protein
MRTESSNNSFIKVALVVLLYLAGVHEAWSATCYDYDLFKDGYIDFKDLSVITENWLATNCLTDGCGGADFNDQNGVDAADFASLAQYWSQSCSLPKVVGENVSTLPITEGISGIWQWSANMSVAKSPVTWQDSNTLAINYNIQSSSGELYYILPPDHFVGERLRFWLKGSNTGHVLKISCYMSSDNAWVEQASIPLSFSEWRHFEIPATNAFYNYYKTVTQFHFSIQGAGAGNYQLLLSKMELVSPELIKAPIAAKTRPSPMFDTWGGPSQQQMIASKPAGITVHISPIGFFNDTTIDQRVSYARSAVKWASDAGLMPAIQFYNNPGSWTTTHPELLVKNQYGQNQPDAGGMFTSPWNPTARALWQQHIIDCLNNLKTYDRLKYVKVVELSPGEEGEVSYEWSDVYAFDDYAIAAYREYLRLLYNNDITKLNADWNSNQTGFDNLLPPADWYPDRAHWVFTDFYRLSMLEYYVFLGKAVKSVFEPNYWWCMPHTYPNYPGRFYSARYPLFYAENMARLGMLDYAQIAVLDWQHREDVDYLQNLGLKVIGEKDVQPTADSLTWTFAQAKKYGTDGVFIGILEPLSSSGQLTSLGLLCQQLIHDFSLTVTPGAEIIFEDFENVSDWYAGYGAGSGGGSIQTNSSQAQVGSFAGAMSYTHTNAVTYDYADFGRNMSGAPIDMSNVMQIKFKAKFPNDPYCIEQLQFLSASGGFLEYNFPEGDGQWHDVLLSFPQDFVDYGSNPSLNNINLIRFRSIGDTSSSPTSNTFYIDQLIFVNK